MYIIIYQYKMLWAIKSIKESNVRLHNVAYHLIYDVQVLATDLVDFL